MKLKITGAILSLACAAGLLVAPLRGFPIFGGLPVYDSANHIEQLLHTAKFVSQIAIMTNQLTQLVDTYKRLTQTYQHVVRQAVYLKDMVRYRIPATVWRGLTARDTTGTAGGWLGAVNSGIGTVEGWTKATIDRVPVILNNFPGPHHKDLNAQIATMDLQDGSAIAAMDTLGRVRIAGPVIETSLASLETDSLFGGDELQTEAAQMNKSNAIAMIQTRALTDQNKLLVTNTELSLVRLKQERDAAARALAIESTFRAGGKDVLEQVHAGASDAMLNFRLP